jgi:hypothetical protein
MCQSGSSELLKFPKCKLPFCHCKNINQSDPRNVELAIVPMESAFAGNENRDSLKFGNKTACMRTSPQIM